jgi:gliding motility-associated-like protein
MHKAEASHIVGGEITYKYIGDSIVSISPLRIWPKYQVSLTIYEDCQNGQPEAIAQDNPAFFGVYEAAIPFKFLRADSVDYASSVAVPTNFSNACVSNIPPTCLTKKTFIINYALPPNASGYIIDYARCCRNATVNNILKAGNTGSLYFCYIPPYPMRNSSVVFKNYPPQIICLNNPLYYDHSAIDPDGDSLSYGFTQGLVGAHETDIKPFPPDMPPFDTVIYQPGYSSQHPMPGFPQIQIDPRTGVISGTPNTIGRFLVTVYCNEYRDGILINTVIREFQFVVTSCTKVVIADIPQFSTDPNTYIVNCEDFGVHFVNKSQGGFSYHWDFGLLGNADSATAFEPDFIYPDTGTFAVKLVVNPRSTCPDSITRLVKIYPKFHAAFTDSGNFCPGAPIKFTDLSSATIKPITYWKWLFSDGDSSFVQNPEHTFPAGGIYNVILISKNVKNCADTAMHQVFINNFIPFAGSDTFIVKDERIQFQATGGTQYLWSPPTYLSDTNTFNPVGYFPDTGRFTYYLHVRSPYGCEGYDTITVTVVNQAAFFVPNAFTPNGDGMNDIFRPYTIGYKSLTYFRIYNRWGEEIYNTSNLEVGWNGTYNKKQCDIGTYYWHISYTDRFGNAGYMKGDVHLLR